MAVWFFCCCEVGRLCGAGCNEIYSYLHIVSKGLCLIFFSHGLHRFSLIGWISFFWDALKYIPTEISSLRDFALGNGFGFVFVVLTWFFCLYLLGLFLFYVLSCFTDKKNRRMAVWFCFCCCEVGRLC